jgi:hypothetical protein
VAIFDAKTDEFWSQMRYFIFKFNVGASKSLFKTPKITNFRRKTWVETKIAINMKIARGPKIGRLFS